MYGTFLSVPRFRLLGESGSVSFWGWMFYDSSRQNTRRYARQQRDDYIRLYVTDLNWVVLECVRKTPQTREVSFHPTLDEVFDALAAKPLEVVSLQLYRDFMKDMHELAEV